MILSTRLLFAFLFTGCFLIEAATTSIPALLHQEGLLVKDKIVEDAGEEDTLKHDEVPHNFTGEKSVLQLLVLDEVVEPLLAEAWHATHFEEV